jgi:chlorobactene glucosyltransferase
MNSLEMILVVAGIVLYAPTILVALMNLVMWRRDVVTGTTSRSSVSVLIPARNEETNLENCVKAAVSNAQSLAEILIYNDDSTDQTQRVIDQLRVEFAGTVRQIARRDLPKNWAGKTHACQRLAEGAHARWLLFIDADTQLMPGAIDQLVGIAEKRNASLLSAWPHIEMRSIPERLLMPLLNFVVFTLFPAPIARIRTGPTLGLAHGACILADREAYMRLGGHTLVQAQIFEDTSLAREWRAHGENSQVTDGRLVASVRMYEDFRGIWNGFTKNYYPAFSSRLSFLIFQLYMSVTGFLLPAFVLALVASGMLTYAWLPFAAASVAARLLVALRFRHPLLSVLFHPFAVGMMVVLGFRSWWLSEHGGGVEWKGRQYRSSSKLSKDE